MIQICALKSIRATLINKSILGQNGHKLSVDNRRLITHSVPYIPKGGGDGAQKTKS
jgi:hypothetical protein